jgi:hypothetical protein
VSTVLLFGAVFDQASPFYTTSTLGARLLGGIIYKRFLRVKL